MSFTTPKFHLAHLRPPYITAFVNVAIPPSFQNEAKLFLIQQIRELNVFIAKVAVGSQRHHLTVPNLENIHIEPHHTRPVSAVVFHGMANDDLKAIAAYIQQQRALFLAEMVPTQQDGGAIPKLHLEKLHLYFRPSHAKYRLHEYEVMLLLGLTVLAGIAVLSSPYMANWTLCLFAFLAVGVFVLYLSREKVFTPTMSPFFASRRGFHEEHMTDDGLIQSCPHDENTLFGGIGGVCL